MKKNLCFAIIFLCSFVCVRGSERQVALRENKKDVPKRGLLGLFGRQEPTNVNEGSPVNMLEFMSNSPASSPSKSPTSKEGQEDEDEIERKQEEKPQSVPTLKAVVAANVVGQETGDGLKAEAEIQEPVAAGLNILSTERTCVAVQTLITMPKVEGEEESSYETEDSDEASSEEEGESETESVYDTTTEEDEERPDTEIDISQLEAHLSQTEDDLLVSSPSEEDFEDLDVEGAQGVDMISKIVGLIQGGKENSVTEFLAKKAGIKLRKKKFLKKCTLALRKKDAFRDVLAYAQTKKRKSADDFKAIVSLVDLMKDISRDTALEDNEKLSRSATCKNLTIGGLFVVKLGMAAWVVASSLGLLDGVVGGDTVNCNCTAV